MALKKTLDIYELTYSVIDYRKKSMKDVENKYIRKFYSRFQKLLPDHPNPNYDHVIYVWDDLDILVGSTTIYLVFVHFECIDRYYLKKLVKILKILQKKAKSYPEIVYLNANSQDLAIRVYAYGDDLLDEDVKKARPPAYDCFSKVRRAKCRGDEN